MRERMEKIENRYDGEEGEYRGQSEEIQRGRERKGQQRGLRERIQRRESIERRGVRGDIERIYVCGYTEKRDDRGVIDEIEEKKEYNIDTMQNIDMIQIRQRDNRDRG